MLHPPQRISFNPPFIKFNINIKFQILIACHMWASSTQMCEINWQKREVKNRKLVSNHAENGYDVKKLCCDLFSTTALCYYHTSRRRSLVIQSTYDDCLHVYVTLSFTLSKSSKWLRAYKARLSEFVSMLFYASCDKNPFSIRCTAMAWYINWN